MGESTFSDCSGLTSLTIPEGIITIGSFVFNGCTGLASVTIPEGVTTIGSYAFCGCTGLTDLTLPESVTTIGDYAFHFCSGLTSITVPQSVNSIGNSAFYNCSGLTTVNFEGNATVHDYAFFNATNLVTLTLHGNYLCSKAFANCCELTDVYNYGNGSHLGHITADTFEGSYIEYATLHVAAYLLAEAQGTAPWSSFGTIRTFETSIDEIPGTQLSGKHKGNAEFTSNRNIYDLNGRRVEKARKGLYIINGHKVVIK